MPNQILLIKNSQDNDTLHQDFNILYHFLNMYFFSFLGECLIQVKVVSGPKIGMFYCIIYYLLLDNANIILTEVFLTFNRSSNNYKS